MKRSYANSDVLGYCTQIRPATAKAEARPPNMRYDENGVMFTHVYTIQPVVQPVVKPVVQPVVQPVVELVRQPVVSCKRSIRNRTTPSLSHDFASVCNCAHVAIPTSVAGNELNASSLA